MVIRRLSRAETLSIIENFSNRLRSVTYGPDCHVTHVYESPEGKYFAFHFNTYLITERFTHGDEIDEAEANTYHDDLAPN